MTGLAAIGQPEPDRKRLYLGIGLFTTGAVLTALGAVGVVRQALTAVGVSPSLGYSLGILVGGLVLPVGIVGLLYRLPTTDAVLFASKFGGAFIGLALIGFLVINPGEFAVTPVTTMILASYILGVSSLLAALLVTVAKATVRDPSTADRTAFSQRRSGAVRPGTRTRSQSPRSLPTDGGESDDDLTFPLDDDSPEK